MLVSGMLVTRVICTMFELMLEGEVSQFLFPFRSHVAAGANLRVWVGQGVFGAECRSYTSCTVNVVATNLISWRGDHLMDHCRGSARAGPWHETMCS